MNQQMKKNQQQNVAALATRIAQLKRQLGEGILSEEHIKGWEDKAQELTEAVKQQ